MLLKNLLLVGLGGGLGSMVRFLCQKYVYEWHPHHFPFGTFIVNIAGCFLIGIFYALADREQWLSPQWRVLLTTGFCGGFTTFSSFAFENISLLKHGEIGYLLLYTLGSVVLGIAACWAGIWLIK